MRKIRGLIYESKTGGGGVVVKGAKRDHCSHQYDDTLGSANLACWDGENFLTPRDGSANLFLSFKNANHFIQELSECSEFKPQRLMRMWKQNRSCSVSLTTKTLTFGACPNKRELPRAAPPALLWTRSYFTCTLQPRRQISLPALSSRKDLIRSLLLQAIQVTHWTGPH